MPVEPSFSRSSRASKSFALSSPSTRRDISKDISSSSSIFVRAFKSVIIKSLLRTSEILIKSPSLQIPSLLYPRLYQAEVAVAAPVKDVYAARDGIRKHEEIPLAYAQLERSLLHGHGLHEHIFRLYYAGQLRLAFIDVGRRVHRGFGVSELMVFDLLLVLPYLLLQFLERHVYGRVHVLRDLAGLYGNILRRYRGFRYVAYLFHGQKPVHLHRLDQILREPFRFFRGVTPQGFR